MIIYKIELGFSEVSRSKIKKVIVLLKEIAEDEKGFLHFTRDYMKEIGKGV